MQIYLRRLVRMNEPSITLPDTQRRVSRSAPRIMYSLPDHSVREWLPPRPRMARSNGHTKSAIFNWYFARMRFTRLVPKERVEYCSTIHRGQRSPVSLPAVPVPELRDVWIVSSFAQRAVQSGL